MNMKETEETRMKTTGIKEIKMKGIEDRYDPTESSLQALFRETSRPRPLTLEEELGLARRIRLGDDEALHHLIISNIQFVVSVAKRYTDSGISLEDLVAEGILGLVRAAERYDPDYGVKFITYAGWVPFRNPFHRLSIEAKFRDQYPPDCFSMCFFMDFSVVPCSSRYVATSFLESRSSPFSSAFSNVSRSKRSRSWP